VDVTPRYAALVSEASPMGPDVMNAVGAADPGG
jgi:hypothetical protein